MHATNPYTFFSEASDRAVAAVGYLVTQIENGNKDLAFILVKSYIKHDHIIPILELCSAVLVVEIAESIATHLDL